MDEKTSEQGKQHKTNIINLGKSYTTSLLQQLQKISDADVEQSVPASNTVLKSGADTGETVKDSPCQSSSEMKTLVTSSGSCEYTSETLVQLAAGCGVSPSETSVAQVASTESPAAATLPTSMTDLLKKVPHSPTSIQQSPALMEQRPKTHNFPPKLGSLNPGHGKSAMQTTGDKLLSASLDGQQVLAEGSISNTTPSSIVCTSSGMAHSALPVKSSLIGIQPARVSQACVIDGRAIELSGSIPISQLPGKSNVSQTVVVQNVNQAKNAAFYIQGRCTSGQPGPQVKMRPIAPSPNAPQHMVTSSSTASNVSVTRTGQFVVGSPIIINSVSNPTPGNTMESILKTLIIRPPTSTSNVVISQLEGASALNSPVHNVTPLNIPLTNIADPLQAANQRNVALQRTIQVRAVRPGSQLLNPAAKVQAFPQAQLGVGGGRTVAPIALQSSHSSLVALNSRSLGNQRNQGVGSQVLESSQTAQVSQATIQSASQVPSLSAFEVSHIGSRGTTSFTPTPLANPLGNCQILLSHMQNQTRFPSCMQSTSAATTRASCMEVALPAPMSSTQPSQVLSPPQSQVNYNVALGTAQPHTQVTSQVTVPGGLPVNITRHLTPVNLPVAVQTQANSVLTPQQYPRGSRLPYGVQMQSVQKRDILPAQGMLKSVQNILPCHTPNPVSSLNSNIRSSFVCDEMIDDLSDVRNIINNLPVPPQPTIPSESSVGTSHNTVPISIGSCLAGTTTQSTNLSVLSTASTHHTIPSNFDMCTVNTPTQSSSLAALSEVTSPYAVTSSIGVVATNLQTGCVAGKNFDYDSFMTSSLPQIQQGSDSNQTCTNFLEDSAVSEILDLNSGSVEQVYREQHSVSQCDVEQCVSELFTAVTQESMPPTSSSQGTDSLLGL